MLKKRLGKKGFTLVELIVVLVILAILAAILIPSMVGWIDRANDKAAAVVGRTLTLAAQTLVSENYGAASYTATPAQILELAEVDATAVAYTLKEGTSTVDTVTFTYEGTTYTFKNGTGITAP